MPADEDIPLRYVHFKDQTKSDKHLSCQQCAQTQFMDNYISTTKYTLLNFLPVVCSWC